MSTETKDAPNPERDIIIVAEDSPPNRNILVHLLKKMGYGVMDYENGDQVLKALQSLPEGTNIACVISDIMMPKMDGIQLLKEIRSNPKTAKLPVVLVTAVSEKDYILQAKTHNVNGYILKPVTYQKIATKLKELFPAKQIPLAG